MPRSGCHEGHALKVPLWGLRREGQAVRGFALRSGDAVRGAPAMLRRGHGRTWPGPPPAPPAPHGQRGGTDSQKPRASRGPCAASARLGHLLCSTGDSRAGRILRPARNYSTQRAPRLRRGRRDRSVSAMSRQGSRSSLWHRNSSRLGLGGGWGKGERRPKDLSDFYFIHHLPQRLRVVVCEGCAKVDFVSTFLEI